MKTVRVPEYAVKKLDELIKSLYYDALMFKKYDDFFFEDGGVGCVKYNAQIAKEVSMEFGLYPYNQDEVRNP